MTNQRTQLLDFLASIRSQLIDAAILTDESLDRRDGNGNLLRSHEARIREAIDGLRRDAQLNVPTFPY